MNRKLLVSLVVVVSFLAYFAYQTQLDRADRQIQSYESCAAAGYPVMDSYPPQCRTNSGALFTQDIGNELDLAEFITITDPRPNQFLTSPLTIKGQAVGGWFFEGQFPAKVTADNGDILGEGTMRAKGNWMTASFVQFSGTLNFDSKGNTQGLLLLEKDNPSGLPENAAVLKIPVKF